MIGMNIQTRLVDCICVMLISIGIVMTWSAENNFFDVTGWCGCILVLLGIICYIINGDKQ